MLGEETKEEGDMEESNNYRHQHPLLLILNQDQLIHNQSGVTDCSRCGEKVSAPCFSCAEHCGFFLHKVCAEAPLELNHPLHPLLLMPNAPYSSGGYICDFCDKEDTKFVYHCSCGLDFHIKCALFTFNIAENNLKELEHVPLQDPLISTENGDVELEDVSKCFGCLEPLAKYTHFSPDCGFNFHEKCAKLPFKLNHMLHREHPLVLQFNSERLSCKICLVTRRSRFVYGCSPCKIAIHVECASPSPIIEDKSHPHPFTLFPRRLPFICDACGVEGNYAAYICCTCNIIVHKECISLPCIIISKWHDHRIYHKYFLPRDFRNSDCDICHGEVNPELGCYCCSHCNITFHARCVTEDKYSYSIPSREDEDEISNESSITVLEWNDAKEATKIKHLKHMHNLMLSASVGGECQSRTCLRCVIALTPGARTCLKHEHPLRFYRQYEGKCNACSLYSWQAFCCKDCNFVLDVGCFSLPITAQHKCDEHLLSLTHHDDNNYSESHYCDICEKSRDPNSWFYYCAICDTSAHVGCVLGKYPFLKLKSIYKKKDHPHPLTIVKKKYYYPDCDKCGKPCEDLALECSKSECKYIVHWNCAAPRKLQCLIGWPM
ncbi:hypothetical protein E1A91_D02G024100v1 [Gossypium mustelinum]|uniref:Zinc finger PHD-type domain-containing protein n=1 Tax=Gossypium mustelinum TaxID=34275 RepID=A0A5D2VR45_GOSMU|nr:hypothetical protein E1A91_D02G024100v1 [Gossypium mustelinum]